MQSGLNITNVRSMRPVLPKNEPAAKPAANPESNRWCTRLRIRGTTPTPTGVYRGPRRARIPAAALRGTDQPPGSSRRWGRHRVVSG